MKKNKILIQLINQENIKHQLTMMSMENLRKKKIKRMIFINRFKNKKNKVMMGLENLNKDNKQIILIILNSQFKMKIFLIERN